MMERNKNVEMIRGIAMFCMLLYHYSLSISGMHFGASMNVLIELVGQFALIAFFVLSGFGTYMFFSRKEAANEIITLKNYCIKRLKNLLPPYYFCLVFIIIFTWNLGYLSSNNLYNVLEVVFLVQNFDPFNAINGATWTVATLAQLYLFSSVFYKIVRKTGVKLYPIVLTICVIIKKIAAAYIVANNLERIWLVVIGIRLPFTTIDLFFAGMCSAYLYQKYRETFNRGKILHLFIVMWCALYFAVFFTWSTKIGIYGDSIFSCMFQSLIGLFISILVFLIANEKFTYHSLLGKGVQFVARHEYSIFLWHMILMTNFINVSPDWYAYLNVNCPILLLGILIILAVLIGAFFSSHVKWHKTAEK